MGFDFDFPETSKYIKVYGEFFIGGSVRMKHLVLLCVLICVGIFAWVAPTPALASETFPCCEGGSDPGKECDTGEDCDGICTGGARGLVDSCDLDKDCKNACVGGVEPGKECEVDSDCDGICVGGGKAGDACEVESDCESDGNDGTCSPGFCSDISSCSAGSCTGVCDENGPKSPSEPISVEWEFPVCLDAVEVE